MPSFTSMILRKGQDPQFIRIRKCDRGSIGLFTIPSDLEKVVHELKHSTRNASQPLREFGYDVFDYLVTRVNYDEQFEQAAQAYQSFVITHNITGPRVLKHTVAGRTILFSAKPNVPAGMPKKPLYRPAKKVWRDKRAVCGDMSILYAGCMKAAGLTSTVVKVSRDFDNKTVNHACALVKFETDTLVDLALFKFDAQHSDWSYFKEDELRKYCMNPSHVEFQYQMMRGNEMRYQHFLKMHEQSKSHQ